MESPGASSSSFIVSAIACPGLPMASRALTRPSRACSSLSFCAARLLHSCSASSCRPRLCRSCASRRRSCTSPGTSSRPRRRCFSAISAWPARWAMSTTPASTSKFFGSSAATFSAVSTASGNWFWRASSSASSSSPGPQSGAMATHLRSASKAPLMLPDFSAIRPASMKMRASPGRMRCAWFSVCAASRNAPCAIWVRAVSRYLRMGSAWTAVALMDGWRGRRSKLGIMRDSPYHHRSCRWRRAAAATPA